jgi:hypothetical protein
LIDLFSISIILNKAAIANIFKVFLFFQGFSDICDTGLETLIVTGRDTYTQFLSGRVEVGEEGDFS